MVNYTLAFASSLDGFIARHSNDNPFEWTSKNDQDHLKNLINQHEWQVMGRKTHELNPRKDRKRIVFSRQVQSIQSINPTIPNQMYFNPDVCQISEFENFVGDIPWVHIDIAGPAFADGPKPSRDAGATGVMVRSLIRWVENSSV